jgi:hypothetical protein
MRKDRFFTFLGQMQGLRKKSDQWKRVYLVRYSPTLFFILVLILILNILDSLFTMILLDLGGQEFNPILHSIMALHGDRFWIWKFFIVSGSLVLLSLHRGFTLIRNIVIVIGSIYLIIVLYQIFLITHLRTPALR